MMNSKYAFIRSYPNREQRRGVKHVKSKIPHPQQSKKRDVPFLFIPF